MNINTYNSKFDTYGNRKNLVVNEDKKEIYFSGCNAFNLGNVTEDLGIREVNRMYKEFLADGYTEVKHSEVRDNWN